MITELPISIVSRLIEESLDAVVIIDANGAMRYLNGAMQALSGYAPGEALGQSLNGLLPEDVAAVHGNFLAHYLRGDRNVTVLGRVREMSIRHRTGEIIPVELKALDLGVNDGVHYFGAYLVDLRARRRIEAENAALMTRLAQEALSDALTTLPNRRAFDAEAARMVARAKRSGAGAVVGVADLDHFKQVNDRYGHPVGDLVLCEVARVIEGAARHADFVARVGGEEFALLLPETTLAAATRIAERIRKAVGAAQVTTPDGEVIQVTISIGLADMSPPTTIDDALARADSALYEAKNSGRNRVACA